MDVAAGPRLDGPAGRGADLERLLDEQTALRRIATLVAAGASDADLVTAVTAEIAHLFGAQRANAVRWDGDTIRVIGEWSSDHGSITLAERTLPFGVDTITTRGVDLAGPARWDFGIDYHSVVVRSWGV